MSQVTHKHPDGWSFSPGFSGSRARRVSIAGNARLSVSIGEAVFKRTLGYQPRQMSSGI